MKEIILFSLKDLEEILDLNKRYKIIDINVSKPFEREECTALAVKVLDTDSTSEEFEGSYHMVYYWGMDKDRYKTGE